MEKVRFGIIGAGGIARRRTIPGMLQAENIEVRAVMDIVNAQEIADEFKVPRAYNSLNALLADPEIDAVYIATPVNRHLTQIMAAAACGKHILCEKPLTMNSADAAVAVAACKKAGVYLQEGYMMTFHGAHQAIRQLIAAGKIGKVVYMRAQLSCWYPPIPGAWRQDPAQGGGGALIDMATHLYDLLAFFAGPINRVVAFTGRQVQGYQSEDSSTTLLEFAGGAHGTVDAFFCIPDEASRTRLEIYGSQGSIFAEGTIGQSQGGTVEGIFGIGAGGYDAAQTKDVARSFAPVPFAELNPYTAECAAFADCILNKRPPQVNNGDNAIRIMKITEAAYTSAKDGCVHVIK
ncbi:Gfo/Idh/MocA family protein [Oligosphaera ethanolica]|uniref:Dehydrogenase n=1 Tax=Oligosphaera ethanolica TaxID=760260 RepID=A0AAE3VEK7_9BACT|nr:Gfo/Idh/MocA family oxidoreductase [Oligosphaera ethanolica]MDQ0289055.1 putative dehydrogenase [Oligosphaera ethanolica]